MDAFAVLADPTRRSIIEMLSSGDRNAGQIAASFSVSRPAISRHLRVLREAGLVVATERAQQRIYRLQPQQLTAVREWIDKYSSFWEQRLDDLVEHVEGQAQEGDAT